MNSENNKNDIFEDKIIEFSIDYVGFPPLYQFKTLLISIEALYNKIIRSEKTTKFKLTKDEKLKINLISLENPLKIKLFGNPYFIGLLFFLLTLLCNKVDQIRNREFLENKFQKIENLLDRKRKLHFKNSINQPLRKKSARKITIKYKDMNITLTEKEFKQKDKTLH